MSQIQILDSVSRIDAKTRKAQNERRFDAIGDFDGALAARNLEHIYEEVLREEFPPQNALEFFPIDSSVPPGARSHTIRRLEARGQAKVHRGNAPVPVVSLAQEEQESRVRHYVIGVEFDIFELQAASYAGFGLRQELEDAAYVILQEFLNEKTWFGDDENSITGVLNYPWLPKIAITQPFSSTASVGDMLAALSYAATRAHTETNTVYQPDSLLVSPRLYRILQSARFNTPDGTRLLAEFQATNPSIRNIDQAVELQGTGPGGTDQMLFYRRDRRSIANVIPQAFTMLPAQQRGFTWEIPCYMSHGGIVMRDVLNNLLAYVEVE